MHFIEEKIREKLESKILLWLRYHDDCFIIFKDMAISELLDVSNSISSRIQFTEEIMCDNEISFLDISILKSGEHFETGLFMKEVHSGCIVPWSSNHPKKMKHNIVYNEFLRVKRPSSNLEREKQSHHIIEKKFRRNGYRLMSLTQYRGKSDGKTVPLVFGESKTIRYVSVFLTLVMWPVGSSMLWFLAQNFQTICNLLIVSRPLVPS